MSELAAEISVAAEPNPDLERGDIVDGLKSKHEARIFILDQLRLLLDISNKFSFPAISQCLILALTLVCREPS